MSGERPAALGEGCGEYRHTSTAPGARSNHTSRRTEFMTTSTTPAPRRVSTFDHRALSTRPEWLRLTEALNDAAVKLTRSTLTGDEFDAAVLALLATIDHGVQCELCLPSRRINFPIASTVEADGSWWLVYRCPAGHVYERGTRPGFAEAAPR
jgi:hypothetical protein